MTNDRRTAFRNAFQNLQLLPLVKPEDIRRFRVDYGLEYLEQLMQLVEDCSTNNNKVIFTGHRGSGKSTLLGQFSLEINGCDVNGVRRKS
jgi:putative ribosome biogenesis GTPase RsgA